MFVQYTSPLGFSFKVPEGWARKDLADGAEFADKYGRIAVTQTAAATAPDVAAANQTLVPELKKSASPGRITLIVSPKPP